MADDASHEDSSPDADGVWGARRERQSMTGRRVVFTPSGITGDVPVGTTVLDAARRFGVDLDSVCGGRGICGRCAVVPTAGRFDKWAIEAPADAFGPRNPVEDAYAARRPLPADHRLGCQAVVRVDSVIDVPAASQLHRPVVRKSVDVGDLVCDPVVRLYFVTVDAARLDDGRSAAVRLVDALESQHGIVEVQVAFAALGSVAAAVGASDGCTVALDGSRVVAAWPGYVDTVHGIAVDIGSTTIAGHLCDLMTGEVLSSGGLMNPQIRFGEDLMSRVSYVMMNPAGAHALTAAVREGLDELTAGLLDRAGVEVDTVVEVVVVGNPIMHHIALGLDPTPLGGAPFELAVSDSVRVHAAEIVPRLRTAQLYAAPLIAGHVGADTAAAILADGPHRRLDGLVTLLIDVGTNAEIVLGDAKRLYAASSPTGPAFEGAQISCGQRAAAGAIERVRIDPDTLEPRVRVIGSDLWSDDPAFRRSAGPSVSGVCGSGIIEVMGELFLRGVLRSDGTFDPASAQRSERVVADGRTFAYELHRDGDVVLRVTQNDVRAIQLAKAALRAGIELLRERSGLERIDRIVLAGAFGTHIDPLYALLLGLVPDAPLAAVTSIGNAAGTGAVRLLLSAADRREIERVVRDVVKIETALEPRFQEHFVAAMGFPHSTCASPYLAELVRLPPPTTDRTTQRRSRSRSTT